MNTEVDAELHDQLLGSSAEAHRAIVTLMVGQLAVIAAFFAVMWMS